ncbi:Arc family DNA-binding protein [Mesorhizobium sp. B263B2A]|uniref:Arc family DNA-binding protein n=1 Tax=Mesorhizobium sp. B263B2A TaxID=2876669 RepID=UPI001CD06216|nr:Arc family DNA-binding protein [Mesorhizobium sp. B263B2A]MCA0032713.1 Arc family DNA-binding protein [Mesorhizobium sp. B263B2A]
MPQPDQPRFNLRLTPEIEAALVRARKVSARSMNAEILARLRLTFDQDPAARLTEIFRPLVERLDDDERARFIDSVERTIEVLVQAIKG